MNAILRFIVPRKALSLRSVDYRWWTLDGDEVERVQWGQRMRPRRSDIT